MNKTAFTSAFAPDLDRYLAFKGSMGFHSDYRVWYLKNFDRYCGQHSLQDLDRSTVEGWVASRLSAHPRGSRSWMSCIRDFGRWERINGKENAYVLSDQWKTSSSHAPPYLLTNEEITRFFDAATQLEIRSPWRWQGFAFFALMHSCGLRTCEVRRLQRDDVKLAEGVIDVRWSKGNRSRQLPLTGELVEVMAGCDRASQDAFGKDRKAFFISSRGNPVDPVSVGVIFNRIWDQARLTRPPEGKQPRPYDFRHHYAYANIERWMAEGTDVNTMLPYLARYMGHALLKSTYYYIHTSPDFMNGYAEMTRETQGILPEVGFE